MISLNIFSFIIHTKTTVQGYEYGDIEERNREYPGMLATSYEEILLKAVARYSGILSEYEVQQCISDLKENNCCSHSDPEGWNSFSVGIKDVITVVV